MTPSRKRKKKTAKIPKRYVKPNNQVSPHPLFSPTAAQRPNLPRALNTINLAKILNGVLTFRTALKKLSNSIQQIEKIMDSTFQFLEIAKAFSSQRKSSNNFLPAPKKKAENKSSDPKELIDDLEVPDLSIPAYPVEPRERNVNDNSSWLNIFQNLDFQQIGNLLQNPLLQRLLFHFLQPKQASYRPYIKRESKKRG